MFKYEIQTEEGRLALETERIAELERKHKEQLEFIERQNAAEKAELQRRLTLIDQSTAIAGAKDSGEAMARLVKSFEYNSLPAEQQSLAKDALRFFGADSSKHSGDANRLALQDLNRYHAIKRTAVALGILKVSR